MLHGAVTSRRCLERIGEVRAHSCYAALNDGTGQSLEEDNSQTRACRRPVFRRRPADRSQQDTATSPATAGPVPALLNIRGGGGSRASRRRTAEAPSVATIVSGCGVHREAIAVGSQRRASQCASRKTSSLEATLYRSKMDRLLCPVSFMATRSGTPRRSCSALQCVGGRAGCGQDSLWFPQIPIWMIN
jgi:hypothetical protein